MRSMAMNSSSSSSLQICSDLVDSKLDENVQPGGAKQYCPGCGHILDRRAAWIGLPAGVKFDPTDQELIEHLEAKVRCEELRSHPLIDEFITTIQGEDGICYTHPEKLPGVTKDGLSKHFFHRPSKAYTTGTRKRRKIQNEADGGGGGGETRWHKTGKTRPVTVNGQQKGCKKILVLYTNFGKHRKPEKTNWVMHQYHLGMLEEEREGELVVSKVFYQTQPRQCSAVGSGGTAICAGIGSTSLMGMGSADELACVTVGISGGYGAGAGDSFSFSPFRKSFDEVGVQHEDRIAATAAYHISRRTEPISGIVPPAGRLHQASIVLEEPYRRLILQNESLERQQQEEVQQEQQKLIGRPSSGLEEVILGCSSNAGHANEASIPSNQEEGWLRYPYWPDSSSQEQQR